ncbi:unnamed protein product [Caenorhabditis auriculariae]|uniref:Uncharacterized protein n=1 Tax=Caenorhabditis auriculariae TaxID=2777116 RepID=A0A8S1HUQ9_9PELO|nr:unnamed protein product [Caenorhabditis auriculariae]
MARIRTATDLIRPKAGFTKNGSLLAETRSHPEGATRRRRSEPSCYDLGIRCLDLHRLTPNPVFYHAEVFFDSHLISERAFEIIFMSKPIDKQLLRPGLTQKAPRGGGDPSPPAMILVGVVIATLQCRRPDMRNPLSRLAPAYA